MNILEKLAHWDTEEGRPYKGSLIDWDAYGGDGEEPPANIGCMCAQGQVLHLIGGWTPQRIHDIEQAKADLETAALLSISISHAVILRAINDQAEGAPMIVLTHPEKVLGTKAPSILAFWLHLDKMNLEDWKAARDAQDARDARDARDAWDAWDAQDAQAAWDAWAAWATWDARDARAAWDAWDAGDARAAWDAWDAWDARAAWNAWDAWDAWDARDATYAAAAEIVGVKWLREHDEGKFVFLPMFGFADPSAIPPLPLNYGKGQP